MKIGNVFVSKNAIELAKALIDDGESRNPEYDRSVAFNFVDKFKKYPKNTMAQYYGKIESRITKNKLNIHKKFGKGKTTISKPKEKWKLPTRGKIYQM